METLIIVDIFLAIALLSIFIIHITKNYRIIKIFNKELLELRQNYISYNTKVAFKEKYRNFRDNLSMNVSNRVKGFINIYDNFFNLVDVYNNQYIKEELENKKEFFDKLFDYPLDLEQRKAIITDEDNNLIIAGAGSGKTTTIIGKTKYLVETKGVDPRLIITILFTNAAKDNFIEKLNDNRVYCSTFHKLGKDIIDVGHSRSDIAPEDYIYTCIREYISNFIKNDSKKSENFVKLYSLYLHNHDAELKDFGDAIELLKGYDFTTLKSKTQNINIQNLEYYKKDDKQTLKLEKVKSMQELTIANYMFIHGINYEYEAKYKYDTSEKHHKQYHPDFYLVDYDIYLEHFGINESGRAPQYDYIEEKKYLDTMKWKRKVHKEYKTKLMETYSYEFNNNKIEEALSNKFREYGVEEHDISYVELIDAISKINNEEIYSFYSLISKFIKMFKGNNYDVSKFDEFYKEAKKKDNIRSMYLLELMKDIYIYYQNELIRNGYMDFDDMINLATSKIISSFNNKLSYIIIDEFQDISYSRYRLVKAIQDKTNAKVIAVGDDWQSIYRFSGCDLNLFVHFDEYFPHPKIMCINNTYRNCQNLIDIAGMFIMQNDKGQIKKKLKSLKDNIDNPIEYIFYNENVIKAAEKAIDKLKDLGCKKIAILGRNNSDIERFGYGKRSNEKEIDLSKRFKYNVIFTTVHKAKGLEWDGVIICNFDNYVSGFPNKMADDPILDYVTLTTDDYLYEEERRLLYVALTRTKTKCLILIPKKNPSIFSDELFKLSKESIPKTILEQDSNDYNSFCPKCKKGTLVLRENSTDKTLFVGCTNYPLCDFKSDKINLDKPIRCPRCNSYMVLRKGVNGYFYGCLNYPYCTQTINKEKINIKNKENNKQIEIKCPKCGARMVKRKSKQGVFYGCRRYPECRKTIDIKDIDRYI